jgi:DNA replicative helicase MCM subunit Mcm2 (Cdc46/Mcm family)
MARADHTWSGRSFKDLSRWIENFMPRHIRLTDSAMSEWRSLTDEVRRDRMIEWKLRPGVFDILKGSIA